MAYDTEILPAIGAQIAVDVLDTIDGVAAPDDAKAEIVKIAFGAVGAAVGISSTNPLPVTHAELLVRLGAVADSPAPNTLLARLKAVETALGGTLRVDSPIKASAIDPGATVELAIGEPGEAVGDHSEDPVRTRVNICNLSATNDVWLSFSDDSDDCEIGKGQRVPPGGDHVEYEYKGAIFAVCAAAATLSRVVV